MSETTTTGADSQAKIYVDMGLVTQLMQSHSLNSETAIAVAMIHERIRFRLTQTGGIDWKETHWTFHTAASLAADFPCWPGVLCTDKTSGEKRLRYRKLEEYLRIAQETKVVIAERPTGRVFWRVNGATLYRVNSEARLDDSIIPTQTSLDTLNDVVEAAGAADSLDLVSAFMDQIQDGLGLDAAGRRDVAKPFQAWADKARTPIDLSHANAFIERVLEAQPRSIVGFSVSLAKDWTTEYSDRDLSAVDASVEAPEPERILSRLEDLPDDSEAAELWNRTLTRIEPQVTPANFNNSLKGTIGIARQDNVFHVSVSNDVIAEYLDRQLYPLLQRTLTDVTGSEFELAFRVVRALAPVTLGQKF